jgi:serine/threonine protein kinase
VRTRTLILVFNFRPEGHFHQRLIAYRDLKLENVLIDEVGYCKVVDLGFAKVVVDKTYTLVGTPEYLAPEIILSKGHNHAVDYWAFGVLSYELLVGHSPFYKPNTSQIDMFKRIVMLKYSFPAEVNNAAKMLIESLLVRATSKRLGNLSKGYLDVKSHPWFQESGVDFRAILKKTQEPPWKPEIKDPLDSSNFDDYSSQERAISFGRRLTREEQNIFKGF